MSLKNKLLPCLFAILTLSFIDVSLQEKINIVFIGDSITEGGDSIAPPDYAAKYLRDKIGSENVYYSNQGVSGCTTVDFLPSTNTYFNNVAKAADSLYRNKDGQLIFSIMLGTNDSAIKGPLGAPVPPEEYKKNLELIIGKLMNDYPESKFMIHHPLWYSPSTYNKSKYLREGLSRLQSYMPVIDQLVKKYPGKVFAGDKKGFNYFKKHHLTHMYAENGQQGVFYLHPNETGMPALGKLWGQAIEKMLPLLK